MPCDTISGSDMSLSLCFCLIIVIVYLQMPILVNKGNYDFKWNRYGPK